MCDRLDAHATKCDTLDKAAHVFVFVYMGICTCHMYRLHVRATRRDALVRATKRDADRGCSRVCVRVYGCMCVYVQASCTCHET